MSIDQNLASMFTSLHQVFRTDRIPPVQLPRFSVENPGESPPVCRFAIVLSILSHCLPSKNVKANFSGKLLRIFAIGRYDLRIRISRDGALVLHSFSVNWPRNAREIGYAEVGACLSRLLARSPTAIPDCIHFLRRLRPRGLFLSILDEVCARQAELGFELVAHRVSANIWLSNWGAAFGMFTLGYADRYVFFMSHVPMRSFGR
jgi:hypothetical protein